MVRALGRDLRLGLWIASGLLFDLGQITWAVSVVLDQGEMRCWNGPHIHCISYLVSREGELGSVDQKRVGTYLACLLVRACKAGGVLMSAVQPGQASSFFSKITKSIGIAFTNLVRELR